jgi:hypothetical protein
MGTFMDGCFYERVGDSFIPTEYTIGPWSRESQHGGPPAALLGRCIEEEAGPNKQIGRITFDILRPIPLGQLEIEVTVVRPGRKVALIDGSISIGGDTVMRASAWAIRKTELSIPMVGERRPVDSPEDIAPMDPTDIVSDISYLHATDWRFVTGGFLTPGPAIAWLRTRVPLVEGEEDTPLVKVLAIADSASGVSGALDFRSWLYINTDLSVYLHRMPEGPWIRVDASTTVEPIGIALTSGSLSDGTGPIGTSSQTLFLDRR